MSRGCFGFFLRFDLEAGLSVATGDIVIESSNVKSITSSEVVDLFLAFGFTSNESSSVSDSSAPSYLHSSLSQLSLLHPRNHLPIFQWFHCTVDNTGNPAIIVLQLSVRLLLDLFALMMMYWSFSFGASISATATSIAYILLLHIFLDGHAYGRMIITPSRQWIEGYGVHHGCLGINIQLMVFVIIEWQWRRWWFVVFVVFGMMMITIIVIIIGSRRRINNIIHRSSGIQRAQNMRGLPWQWRTSSPSTALYGGSQLYYTLIRPPNAKSIFRRLLPDALFTVLDVAAVVVLPHLDHRRYAMALLIIGRLEPKLWQR